MISIVTRYRKHDCTIAALAIARRFEEQARQYSIFCYDLRVNNIDPTYDSRVKHIAFQDWLIKTNHIIWTSPVDNYFIDTARKRGIRSTLYTSWDQLEPYDEKVIGLYTHVLVPSLLQAIQLRDRFKLRNVAVLPYDSGLPHTIKSANDCCRDNVHLFLSLYGTQLRRVDLSAIIMMAQIVRDLPHVHVTIACCKGLARYTKHELKVLAKRYPVRWHVLVDCAWPDQVIQMGLSDLTVWPARLDGFGLVGNTSLAMGTPVIAWDATPMNEHLMAGRNSLLVSCDIEYNWLGVPQVKPDYNEFDRVLRQLLVRPDILAELRRHTNEQLDIRRKDFRKGWDAILPTAI